MARAEDHATRDSADVGSRSGDSSDSDSGSSGYDSDSGVESASNGSEEEDEEEEEKEDADDVAEAAKRRLVRADVDAMRRMAADMDAIKARLQQRFAAERQARLERAAREDRERDEQQEARRRAERGRQAEVAVQTDTAVVQQQTNVSQRDLCPPNLADGAGAALSAVDGGTGYADVAPNKPKPAGLSLYDLVKASGFGLSRKAPSPVRQPDPPTVLPTSSSDAHEQESPEQQQQQQQQEQHRTFVAEQDWGGSDSRRLSHDHDSVVGDDANDYSIRRSRRDASFRSTPRHSQQPMVDKTSPRAHYYDENSGSVSNSLVSSDAGNRSAVFPDQGQRRDHKFNAAALLGTLKSQNTTFPAPANDDKTDDQREMEAIQCLLFGQRR
ncbi:unnamed protein product [Phytophthora lilii]|uniref:Unnamed protein product n=1 Tax=Phytophthora lilii TaxID=2077276 RepID=A0A9W6X184_9STRA|nr:unnamed protein product [Phytophthora lilii]